MQISAKIFSSNFGIKILFKKIKKIANIGKNLGLFKKIKKI